MTEKRYQWYIDGVDIWDNQKEERIDDTPTLLNELSKENGDLKLISNYRGEMVSFATSLIQDMGSEEMLKIWNDFTEFMYQKWKKKRGIK